MDSPSTGRVAQTLHRLFEEAGRADRPLMASFMQAGQPEQSMAEIIADISPARRATCRASITAAPTVS